MTETADTTTLSVDERAASARGFFDVGPAGSSATISEAFLPPPPPVFPTATMPAIAAPSVPAAVPQLPHIAPTQPSQAAATPFAFSPAPGTNTPTTTSPHKKKKSGGGRRFISWVIVLGVIGGVVYAGVKYGPDMMDRAKDDDPTAGEPEAPLAFPPAVALATPARMGTFLIERPADDGSTLRYEVTNDFETGVSRMLVDRTTLPDIEVLAVFDVANLRQADQPNWYSTPRGQFPFAGGSDRDRLVRTVDQYFPAAMRPFVTIQRASESVLGTETMRHLVVTVDAAGIANAATTVATDPLTGLQVAAPPSAPGEFVLPTSVTGTTDAIEPVTLEMWVDSNGLIRKLVEPPSMGGETVTVTSLSPDAFNPTFPAPEVVTPLTAEQLVDFAL